jgi:predicted DNA binding CopG/RHH family protein
MKYYRFLSKAVVIALVSVTSCKKDTEPAVQDLSGVEEQFKQYVLRFVAEAKARNITVDISRLNIKSVSQRISVNGVSYCGYTFSALPADVNIQIAAINGCWSDLSDASKEILIFHELGHGLLGRSHDDTLLPSGLRKTLMYPTTQFYMYTEFTPALRSYYLDELFNVNTPTPSFGKIKLNSRVIRQDSVAATNKWTFLKNGSSLVHSGSVSSTVYASPHHSLMIKAQPGGSQDQFSYFGDTVSIKGISAGSELVLKAMVKTVNVTTTATIVLRVDYQKKTAAFWTSGQAMAISGTQDFTEYTLKMPYFPEQADAIYVFLMLYDTTTGSVYFDDIQVTNNF